MMIVVVVGVIKKVTSVELMACLPCWKEGRTERQTIKRSTINKHFHALGDTRPLFGFLCQ